MVVKKKSKFISYAAIIFLSLVIVLNISFSLAIFTAKDSLTGDLKFGTIKITTNESGWFSSTQNYYASIKPNDTILNEDIKFNLKEDSQPVYIRVKYDVITNSTNSEILKVCNYLKYRDLNLTSDTDYQWSAKRGNYYYLLDSTGHPLEVNEVRNKDFIFLSTINSQISNDLEYNASLVNDDEISVLIGVEAVQSANIDIASPNTLIEDIEAKLNLIKNVNSSGTYTVTFDLNGAKTSQKGIMYGASVEIPENIQNVMNSSGFEGFSLWENGLGIINSSTNNHTYISNNKIFNVTENITLYVRNITQKYLVEFYSEGIKIQSYYLNAGEDAEYFGVAPSKPGYIFTGWDKSLENITSNTTFNAEFELYN